ncbi:MAG TPA: phosphopyruvate hydratase, partial [Candidatus Paceibacterota bacterium]|nr:phosphopyruvate hydratase [Candidatus Paceibacterota bacterium]
MAIIRSLRASEIMDSRGDPTIEVEIETSAAKATADVPSGASVGRHEAVELRDQDPEVHHGKGVSKAISHIEGELRDALVGKEFDQRQLDAYLCELDGTPNKSRLGGNAILPVSIAFVRAEARERNIPLYQQLATVAGTKPSLPRLLFNVLNGGKHAKGGIDIQESMIAPVGLTTI